MSNRQSGRNTWALSLLPLIWSATCFAGNDEEALIGTDAVMTGGAVIATADDGSALWHNPAGLGGLKPHQVDVQGSVYTLRMWRIPRYLRAPDGQTTNGSTSELVLSPSSVTYVRTLGAGWAFGGGYFLSRTSHLRGFDELSFPDEGGPARWQFGFVHDYALHNFVAGASHELDDRFRVGASLHVVYADLSYANEYSGGITNQDESAFFTASEQGSEDHLGVQLQVGFKWKALENWQLGFSVRTPALGVFHSYEQRGYRTLGFDADELAGLPVAADDDADLNYDVESVTKSEFRADWLLPPELRMGFAQFFGRSWWSFDFDVQTGIRSRTVELGGHRYQAVDRRPIFNARLGTKIELTDLWSIGGGIFTDQGASRKDILGIGVYNFYGLALGAEIGDIHRLAKGERADKIRFTTSIGARYAYGVGRFQTLELPAFYQLIRDRNQIIENGLPTRSTPATAHEITLNLGGGVYF